MSDGKEDFDTSKDEIITPLEFVQRQLEQEAEALAAYPGNFNKCTYIEGPLTQPVYVCVTCKQNPDRINKDPAGICYSCSISCHADHEIIELFNKRSYTCECGTKKFPSKCTLEKGVKLSSNTLVEPLVDSEGWRKIVTTNIYTQNHEGLYCWCHKKYDPETEEDEMIQCLDCQDWYHRSCIGVSETDEERTEFICSSCVANHPILKSYISSDVFKAINRPSPTEINFEEETIVVTDPSKISSNDTLSGSKSNTSTGSPLKRSREETDSTYTSVDNIKSASNTPRSRKQFKLNTVDSAAVTCIRPASNVNTFGNISLFAKKAWIDILCRCEKCEDEYYEQNMEHLFREEDIYSPEEDTETVMSLHDAGLAALSKLPHENAIQLATKMESMRSKLHEFLAPFAASGKVITKEDIQVFFQNAKP